MTETLARSAAVEPNWSSGRGGPGSSDGEPGDWGWSEEPAEDDGPPYRRSPIMRVAALATAAAVVLGSIGTWVVFLAVGPSRPSLVVSSVHVRSVDLTPATTDRGALVTFAISNRSSEPGPASCRVTVTGDHGAIGSRRVWLASLAVGQGEAVSVRVPVDPMPQTVRRIAAHVACIPFSH